MKIRRTLKILLFTYLSGTSVLFLNSCSGVSKEGTIIFTRVKAESQDKNFNTAEDMQPAARCEIVALNTANQKGKIRILTHDFYSARSPEISCDGKSLLFAAKKYEKDKWQIWEMVLENSDFRQVTSSADDCTEPDWLPDGKIVFSKSVRNDTVKQTYSLFTISPGQTRPDQITFSPDKFLSPVVLHDGRIVAISRQVIPEIKDPALTVLRPDGTKAELFYKASAGSEIMSGIRESGNGRIVFTESEDGKSRKGDIVSISYNRPLHSKTILTGGIPGSFRSAFPYLSGKMLVTFCPPDSEKYSIYEFDPESGSLGQLVYTDRDNDIIEAVVVEIRDRPKKLPSEVDMEVKSGLLLCQDINFNYTSLMSNDTAFMKADKIEIIGIDSTFGVIKPETDGSFYLKVVADTPFRLRTIDSKGNTLNGPGSWLYLRPNERRGCAGCHEDQELTPDNRYCLAVSKQPVLIPVHKSKIDEKEIDLE